MKQFCLTRFAVEHSCLALKQNVSGQSAQGRVEQIGPFCGTLLSFSHLNPNVGPFIQEYAG